MSQKCTRHSVQYCAGTENEADIVLLRTRRPRPDPLPMKKIVPAYIQTYQSPFVIKVFLVVSS